MGTYYHLLNDTKRERVHLDAHVKVGPISLNSAVHMALCNYMLSNKGDTLRFCGDDAWCGDDDYTDVDLLEYEFLFPDVSERIASILSDIYKGQEVYTFNGKTITKEKS